MCACQGGGRGGGGEIITCGGDDARVRSQGSARERYIPVHEHPRTANTRHVEKKNHVLRLQSREIQIAFRELSSV